MKYFKLILVTVRVCEIFRLNTINAVIFLPHNLSRLHSCKFRKRKAFILFTS